VEILNGITTLTLKGTATFSNGEKAFTTAITQEQGQIKIRDFRLD
jgi:hypothetical protein